MTTPPQIYQCPVCKATLSGYDLKEGRPPLVAQHSTERPEFDRDFPTGLTYVRTIRTPCPMSGEPIPIEFPW